MIHRFLLFCMLLAGGSLAAQEVSLCYQSRFDSLAQRDTLDVYLQSLSSDSVGLRAVNFSFVYRDSCATFDTLISSFRGAWGGFLEQTQLDTVAISYQGKSFDRRLKHGNSDPGIPMDTIIWVPPAGDSILAVRVFFHNQCRDEVYMENQQQNPVNQLGDTSFTPLDYLVENCIPPDTMGNDSMNMSLGHQLAWGISLFPNPTSNQLYLTSDQPLPEVRNVRLYTAQGQEIPIDGRLQVLSRRRYQLDLQGLPTGVYGLAARQGARQFFRLLRKGGG
jgi:hypothetical protein